MAYHNNPRGGSTHGEGSAKGAGGTLSNLPGRLKVKNDGSAMGAPAKNTQIAKENSRMRGGGAKGPMAK